MKNTPLKDVDETIEEIISEKLYDENCLPVINDVDIIDYKFEKGMGHLAPSPWDEKDGYDVEKAIFSVTVFDIVQKENIEDWLKEESLVDFLIEELDSSVALNGYDISFEEDYTMTEDIHNAIADWIVEEREAEEMETKVAA